MQTTVDLNWTELVEIEPALGDLEREIVACRRLSYDEAMKAWYGWGSRTRGYKAKLTKLVGWFSSGNDPRMRGHLAYQIAYTHLSGLLLNGAKVRCECRAS